MPASKRARADVTDVEARVLEIVLGLAGELAGSRARDAVSPQASLERELGFGSLERTELLARLEREFEASLDVEHLELDTAHDLALAIASLEPAEGQRTADLAPTPRRARPLSEAVATIHEALWRRAEREPERPQVFLHEDDGTERIVTYADLLEAARLVAGGQREAGVRRGETIALMLPTGFDFLAAFQGTLISGGVPVPIYPPARLDRLEEYATRQAAILRDAGVTMMITVDRARAIADMLRTQVPNLTSVTTVDELVERRSNWRDLEGSGDDPAFIQYTSGSTGNPKGVLLTHRNLLANVRAIGLGLAVRPSDVGASWLPLYHDMGLIGSWLFCLYEGLPIAIQSPLSFLARPERWLWMVHRHRATLSGAPNFAFELCVRRIPDSAIEGLDLSSWRCLSSGAEPILPATLDRFAERFAPYGLRREALMPVYGLAENTVALCFPPPGRGPRVDRIERASFQDRGEAHPATTGTADALEFVSVGSALPGHDVKLVDDEGEELPERRLGRLLFRGPSAMSGYYGKPEATAEISSPGGWLDSGDLAYRVDDEIHIAGRRKDIIIKGGRNLVPHEIEEVVAEVPKLRRGCIAAFGVVRAEQGTEQLVVLAESRVRADEERAGLAAAVTEAVTASIGIPPDHVAIVAPGTVPKTSSGKIRRSEARQLFEKGALGAPPRTPRLRQAQIVARALLSVAKDRVRGIGRWAYLLYLGFTLVPLLLMLWPLGALLPRAAAVRLQRSFVRLALRIAWCPVTTEGAKLPSSGPFVFACNHASYIDIAPLAAVLPLGVAFAAKKEAARWPVVGPLIRRFHLTVDRSDASQSVADAAQIEAALRAGRSVAVFPEATFTATAGLRPFRLGAFRSAVATGTPIVPMALRGTRQMLREGKLMFRRGPISLWIGEPIAPRGEDWDAMIGLRNEVADAIAANCGEPRLEIVAGGYLPSKEEPRQ